MTVHRRRYPTIPTLCTCRTDCIERTTTVETACHRGKCWSTIRRLVTRRAVINTDNTLPATQNHGNLPQQFQPQSQQQPMPAVNVSHQVRVSHQPLAQNQPTNTPQYTNTHNNTINDLSSIVAQLSLPQSELLPLGSDLKNYHAFFTNFKTNTEARVSDPSVKLKYVIQYCTRTAQDVIADCVINQNKQKGYDSASNVSVSTITPKGLHSLLAKTRAKKAELLRKQRRRTERVTLEQKKLQLETEAEHQKIHIKTQRKFLEIESKNLQLQTDIEVEEAQEKVYAQYEQYKHVSGLSFPIPDTQRKTQVSVSQVHQDGTPVNAHVTVRRKHVTIEENVTDSGEHNANVNSNVPSNSPIGDASWEQLSDQHADSHVAAT